MNNDSYKLRVALEILNKIIADQSLDSVAKIRVYTKIALNKINNDQAG